MIRSVTVSMVLVLSLPGLIDAQLPYLSYGKFSGSVQTEWLDDGRKMRLLSPFSYLDPKGVEWPAPAGWVVDGASIPKFAWSIIGGPFEGRYRNASVIHDVACDQKHRPWEAVHEAFYNAMRASGVELRQAQIMYGAVYHFGPRWSFRLDVAAIPRASVEGSVNKIRAEADRNSQVDVDVRTKPRSPNEILTNQPERADLTIVVTPRERRVQQADFLKLKARIEERASTARDVMSLAEIRNFDFDN